MEDVVILDLSESKITYEWNGWSHMKVMKNLKVLYLSGCRNLRSLPDELGRDLASLEYLSLNGCECLETLPDSIGNLESLIELDISWTGIKELPDSIGKLKNLKRLKMVASSISKIPDALWRIEKLEEIEVSKKINFSKYFHVNIGNCIYKNQSLRILKLRLVGIYTVLKLPESLVTLELSWLRMDTFPDLSNLTNLKELDLDFRRRDGPLEEYPIPWWIGNLSKLESLRLRCDFVTTSPTDLTLPSQLKSLNLFRCTNLRRLPRLPSSLSSLCLISCKSLCSMGDLSNLKNLSSLFISSAAIEEIQGLGCLENLPRLALRELGQVKILPDLSNLKKLTSFNVSGCPNLVEIQGELPQSLKELKISSCESLRKLPDLSSLKELQEVSIKGCKELKGEAILGSAGRSQANLWENLRYLLICDLERMEILPDLSNLKKLRRLQIQSCANLVAIEGEFPECLEELEISSCESLQKLPDLSSLKELYDLSLKGCEELKGDAILGSAGRSQANLWENLQHLWICDRERMEILPDLSNLKKLRRLQIQSCANLVAIEGEFPECLEELEISSCTNIQELPNLSRLNGLREVKIYGCVGLNVEAISSLCSEKSITFLGDERDREDSESESEYDGGEEE